jgi:hypothetical protein
MSKPKKSLSIRLIGLASVFLFSLFILWPTIAAAQFSPGEQKGLSTIGQTAYETSAQPRDIRLVVISIIKTVLSLIGSILVVLMIISGFQYMTAAGNKTGVENAVKRIKNAFIGLIIILVAYAATFFIIQQLTLATAGV